MRRFRLPVGQVSSVAHNHVRDDLGHELIRLELGQQRRPMIVIGDNQLEDTRQLELCSSSFYSSMLHISRRCADGRSARVVLRLVCLSVCVTRFYSIIIIGVDRN
jgi:hypothetical protein